MKINQELTCCVPLPIQIVIDDVGWWSGENGSQMYEPYRTGFVRNHVPADYQAIVDLGQQLGVRPQLGMILSEWDQHNYLATLPSTSKYGNNWSNEKWVGPWLEEAAEIIRKNQEYLEITLHGINHEYWSGRSFTRGEWYDKDGLMRPYDECVQRLELFQKIMDDSQLGVFPESYVPTAFIHKFLPEGDNLFALFKQYGIKYASTPFSTMMNVEKVRRPYFDIDQGVITIDRGKDVLQWDQFDVPLEREVEGPICGMHWSNILHEDPSRNHETVGRWVKHLEKYQSQTNRMLARNTKEMCTQLVYHEMISLNVASDRVSISIEKISDDLSQLMNQTFLLKWQADSKVSFVPENLNIISQKYHQEGRFFELEIEPLNNNCAIKIN